MSSGPTAVPGAPGPQPKQPWMNPDAMYAFGVGLVSLVGSAFATDPKIASVCQMIGGFLTVLGSTLHLDGK